MRRKENAPGRSMGDEQTSQTPSPQITGVPRAIPRCHYLRPDSAKAPPPKPSPWSTRRSDEQCEQAEELGYRDTARFVEGVLNALFHGKFEIIRYSAEDFILPSSWEGYSFPVSLAVFRVWVMEGQNFENCSYFGPSSSISSMSGSTLMSS